MKPETKIMSELVTGMRAAYARGENAMAYARTVAAASRNSTIATLVAYDLQAGSYVAAVRQNPAQAVRWCAQLAGILRGYTTPGGSLLEVGCGESTTLAGVLRLLPAARGAAYGFDLSWSRCAVGQQWLDAEGTSARLFVGDLFEIPLADESIDVVYTSHSLEPNGGRELAALLGASDAQALPLLRQHADLLHQGLGERFVQLQRQIEDFEFESASIELGKLARSCGAASCPCPVRCPRRHPRRHRPPCHSHCRP